MVYVAGFLQQAHVSHWQSAFFAWAEHPHASHLAAAFFPHCEGHCAIAVDTIIAATRVNTVTSVFILNHLSHALQRPDETKAL